MNPKTLRAQAEKEKARARYHLQRATLLEETANQLEQLHAAPGGVLNEQMTPGALKGRNVAISEGKSPRDPLARAVRARLKMSLNAYATHLGISPASLHNYRKGIHAPPDWLRDQVRRETGFDQWPRGVVAK